MNDKYCVLQDDLKDCGVCALLSIIKYYKGNVSKEYLREITNTTKDGVNALNLLKGARTLGFEAYGIKGKITNLSNTYLPLIAHVILDRKYPHFIAVYKIDMKRKRILVMDPAKGFGYYTINNFMRISSGYFLVLKPRHLLLKTDDKASYIDKIQKVVFQYKNISQPTRW